MKRLLYSMLFVSTVASADAFDHPVFAGQVSGVFKEMSGWFVKSEADAVPVVVKKETPPASTVAPVVVPEQSLTERAGQLPHNTISDPKVKKQVEDALSRGDAIIMHSTVR